MLVAENSRRTDLTAQRKIYRNRKSSNRTREEHKLHSPDILYSIGSLMLFEAFVEGEERRVAT